MIVQGRRRDGMQRTRRPRFQSRPRPRLFLLALLVGLLFGASGCGGGSAESAAPVFEEASTAFRAWLTRTDDVLVDLDRSQLGAAGVHLPAPPSEAQLGALAGGREASRIALGAQLSAIKIASLKTLREKDVKAGYCLLFSWYVEYGVTPTQEQLEIALIKYFLGRALPPPPVKRLSGTVGLFRDSIANANSSPQAVANLAMATVCST